MFLMDTDIASAMRRRERNPWVVRWFEAQRTADLYLSVMTIGEIEHGIARQERLNPAFARDLAAWLDSVLNMFGDRILNVSLSVARRWGRLSQRLGYNSTDLVIAATALDAGFTVVTRNVRHFEPTGVRVINPFDPAEER